MKNGSMKARSGNVLPHFVICFFLPVFPLFSPLLFFFLSFFFYIFSLFFPLFCFFLFFLKNSHSLFVTFSCLTDESSVTREVHGNDVKVNDDDGFLSCSSS